MLIYLLIFIVSVTFAFLANKSLVITPSQSPDNGISKKVWGSNAKVMLFLSFLPLFIISAIRYQVGTDYAGTYQTLFIQTLIFGYSFSFAPENLYGLLNFIASLYSGDDYVGVFVLSSLLICAFTYIGFKNSSVNITYSVLLWIITGMYFFSFNGIRQAIAMAIFTFSFQYIQKRRLFPYLLCILFAIGFHRTALLYLPAYFVAYIKLKPSVIALILGIVLIIGAYFRYVAVWFTANIDMFAIFYDRYLSTQAVATQESSLAFSMINILFLALFIVISKLYGKNDSKHHVWINMQLIAVFFSLMVTVLPWASRLIRLYFVILPLSIPSMVALIPNRKEKAFINAGIIFCLCIYMIVTFFVLGNHGVLPYQTIFGR